MRGIVRSVHLVLALVGGVLLSIVTVSGAAVAFRPELDRLHAGPVGAVDGVAGVADRDATVAALRSAFPGARVQRLVTPAAWGGEPDEWWLRDDRGTPPTGDDEAWKVFSDPASGALIGHTRGSRASAALAWLAKFHHDLWLGRTGGILVGSAGLCLAGFVVTGVWLWWPGLRRWRGSLTLRWRQGGLARHRDLHVLVGLAGVPLFLLTALTGSMFEFRWMRGAVHVTLGGRADDRPFVLRPREQLPASARGTGEIGWGAAAAAAEAAAPDARLLSLSAPRPGRDTATWLALLAAPGASTGAYTGIAVHLDRHDATVRARLDPRGMSLGGWINSQVWGLHTGAWGGIPGRTLQLIAGLLPPVLLVTGGAIWYLRRRARRRIAAAPAPVTVSA